MRRVRWQDNDGAVAVVLLGVLLLGVAATLLGSAVYHNEAEACASIAAAATDPATIADDCVRLRADRADTVRYAAILGLLLIVVGVVAARWRWFHTDEPRPAAWRLPLWSLVPALWVPLLLMSVESGYSLIQIGSIAVATGVFAAWFGASLFRDAGVRAHLLAASAVAVPVVDAGIGVVQALRGSSPGSPWRLQDARFPWPVDWSPFVAGLVATAVLYAVAVALAKRGRRAPPIWVGAALFAASTAVTVTVFVTDLVPGWRGRDLVVLPGASTWLPILLAPAVLASIVWTACAVRLEAGERERVAA